MAAQHLSKKKAEAVASAYPLLEVDNRLEVVHHSDARARIPALVRRVAWLKRNQRERRCNVIAKSANRPSCALVVIHAHADTSGKGYFGLNAHSAGMRPSQ